METKPPLISQLVKIQKDYGYIGQDHATALAAEYGMDVGRLYSLMSFFDGFRTCPPGRHKVDVCCGTACYEKGAELIHDRLVDELDLSPYQDTTADGEITLEQVYCVGACSQAPLVVVDGDVRSKMKSHQVPAVVQKLRHQ